MLCKKIIFPILFLLLISCKSKSTNQTINKKREGIWITEYELDSTKYKSIEYYKHNIPVKTWKEYVNEKKYKKEKYKSKICKVTFYHPNGKKESKGLTKQEISAKKSHWFYTGKWKFYSEKGKLIQIKNYEKGNLLSQENIN